VTGRKFPLNVFWSTPANLPDIVRTLSAAGRFARRLNGRQQQRDENADGGDAPPTIRPA
jgi:hypothetical protein